MAGLKILAVLAILLAFAFSFSFVQAQISPDPKTDMIECIVKTSDNVVSKADTHSWSAKTLKEDREASFKQGMIISCKPAGSEWGTLEKDPKRFMTVTFDKSEFNQSWLYPEYGEPICYKANQTSATVYEVECPKDCCGDKGICDGDFDSIDCNPQIAPRKYVLPLEEILTEQELNDVKSIDYNSITDWTLKKTIENVSDKIEAYDYDTRPEEFRTHGSAGQFFICPSGCDYTSLANWVAGEAGDIRAGGNCIATINESFKETGLLTIDGFTTNATAHVIINVTDDARHSGVWDDTKYRLVATGSDGFYVLRIDDYYTDVSGLQIGINTTSGYGNGVFLEGYLKSYNSGVDGIIVKKVAGGDDAYHGIVSGTYPQGCYIRNSMIYGLYGNGILFPTTDLAGYFLTVQNTLVYGCAQGGSAYAGIGRASGSSTLTVVQNCISMNNNGQNDFWASSWGAGTNASVSSDSSAPGVSNATGKTDYATYFTDNETYDFHLTDTGLSLFGIAGMDLSGTFTTDIDGDTRVAWDIGPDEYQAGGGFHAAHNNHRQPDEYDIHHHDRTFQRLPE